MKSNLNKIGTVSVHGSWLRTYLPNLSLNFRGTYVTSKLVYMRSIRVAKIGKWLQFIVNKMKPDKCGLTLRGESSALF